MSCSFSNSTCFSSPFLTSGHDETTFRNSILKWGNDRIPTSRTTPYNTQELSFLDQPYPEPQLLKIECERLRLNRPFVKADRDPANMGMGFAPWAALQRRRSTAFVNITSLRAFKADPERSFKMHIKNPDFSCS